MDIANIIIPNIPVRVKGVLEKYRPLKGVFDKIHSFFFMISRLGPVHRDTLSGSASAEK